MKMWFTCVVLAVTLAYAHGYGTGAPQSACKDMVPRHPVPPQSTPPPYTITSNTKKIKAGIPMDVVIRGNRTSDTIRGLILQARQGDNIVGTFTLPPNDNFAQLLACGEPDNAVTHKKHDAQYDKHVLAYTWTPPNNFSGNIKFRATIAHNGAVFWVGVESEPVTVVS